MVIMVRNQQIHTLLMLDGENVTVEIIDTANDEQELALKEREHIIKNKGPLMLNKHFFSTAHIWGNLEKINAKKYLARVWSEDCNSWIIKMIET